MYLPAYRSGTERVAELRRKHKAGRVLPALYGCWGLVDIETVEEAIAGGRRGSSYLRAVAGLESRGAGANSSCSTISDKMWPSRMWHS